MDSEEEFELVPSSGKQAAKAVLDKAVSAAKASAAFRVERTGRWARGSVLSEEGTDCNRVFMSHTLIGGASGIKVKRGVHPAKCAN